MAKQNHGSSHDRSKSSETLGKDRQNMADSGRKGGSSSKSSSQSRDDQGQFTSNSSSGSRNSVGSSGRSKDDDNS